MRRSWQTEVALALVWLPIAIPMHVIWACQRDTWANFEAYVKFHDAYAERHLNGLPERWLAMTSACICITFLISRARFSLGIAASLLFLAAMIAIETALGVFAGGMPLDFPIAFAEVCWRVLHTVKGVVMVLIGPALCLLIWLGAISRRRRVPHAWKP